MVLFSPFDPKLPLLSFSLFSIMLCQDEACFLVCIAATCEEDRQEVCKESLHPKAQHTPPVVLQEGGSPTARAQQLQWSLQQELRDAKQQAAAAAATRREAEETLADLQAQAQEVAHQHEAFKVVPQPLNKGGGSPN